MDADKIIMNFSGKEYKIRRNTFIKLPQDIFEKAIKIESESDNGKVDEFYFDRHSDSFEAILWYYTNGELHMPVNVCPAVFDKELKFWNIEAQELSKCCFLRYISFFEDQKLLTSFTTGEPGREDLKPTTNLEKPSKWKRIQKKGWEIFDDPTSSIAAKIYVIVSALVILTSIFVVCASTHTCFQRELFLQEWENYFEGDLETVQQIQYLRQNVLNSDSDGLDERMLYLCNANMSDSTPMEKEKCSRENKETTIKPWTYNASLVLKKISNITSGNNYTDGLTMIEDNIPYTNIVFPSNTHARYEYLDYIDACTVVYFAFELLVRFLFCPRKFKFFFEFLNIVDIIALFSEILTLILEYSFPKEKFDDYSPLDVIECIQILRVFRVFRILKNSVDFKILVYSLRESISNMAMMTFLLFIATLIFASVEYYCDRATFRSIPDALWWAVITMTTVGYGDKSPVSDVGKAVGSLCAISGVFVLALLIPVLVNNFILFIGFSKILGKNPEALKTNEDHETKCEAPFGTKGNDEIQNIHLV